MVEVRQTEVPLGSRACRIAQARARITTRIRRLSLGNPGDVTPVGSGCRGRPGSTQVLATGCISSGAETRSSYCFGRRQAKPGSRYRARPCTGTGEAEGQRHGQGNDPLGRRRHSGYQGGHCGLSSTPFWRMATGFAEGCARRHRARQGDDRDCKAAGLGRANLYKALSPDGNPEFTTVARVLKAPGSGSPVAV